MRLISKNLLFMRSYVLFFLGFFILSGQAVFAQTKDQVLINPETSITWYDYPEAKLRALDKITAEATSFTVEVGKPIKFGKIYVKVPVCRKPPPIEKLDSAAFIQVWEKPLKDEPSKWVFSGWMFASSPSLSAMDHPIYDVWLLDCIGEQKTAGSETSQDDLDTKSDENIDGVIKDENKSSFESIIDSLSPNDQKEEH